MTDTKKEFIEAFDKEKYLTDTKELAEAMIDLVRGYSIAQALTAFEASLFFIANIDKDKEKCRKRIEIFCRNMKETYLKDLDKEKENVDSDL
jgi:homoserine acetyltransferase